MRAVLLVLFVVSCSRSAEPSKNADAEPPAGRLPPEQIQSTVRGQYGIFRKCYEAGLARNPNLEGRVIVRFVIDREGAVSLSNLKESTLPDEQATKCIVDGFRALTFPRPDGGIVTVVYPIMFSPG